MDISSLREKVERTSNAREAAKLQESKDLKVLYEACDEGLIKPPKWRYLLFKRCPECNGKLKKTSREIWAGPAASWKAIRQDCIKCDYVWVTGHSTSWLGY